MCASLRFLVKVSFGYNAISVGKAYNHDGNLFSMHFHLSLQRQNNEEK
jgi:hypothetical protein